MSISSPPDDRLEHLHTLNLTRELYLDLTDDLCREDLVRDLKFAGIPKPPLVSDAHWAGRAKQHLTPRRKQAIYLAAMGKSLAFIAEELDYNYASLVRFLNEPDISQIVAHKQEMIFQNNAKGRIKSMMSDAYGVVEHILKDPQEKSSVRLDAAKYVIDHVVGKSTQAIEVKGNLLSQFMSQLDQVIDATNNNVVEENKSEMDNLVSQIVKTEFIVGKRSEE